MLKFGPHCRALGMDGKTSRAKVCSIIYVSRLLVIQSGAAGAFCSERTSYRVLTSGDYPADPAFQSLP